ncbi:hypothetical protein Agabi119p4_6723 [Agaricus bisporus var. burnettii]|uniref:Uncharacterized protein n=1 Tax=Agaricus bisporus var. burnettii TaxID=192524 RepID=A0A8H7CBR1_AGABI|nr:hypothetical protein Agabi119p4_6723 [Agaricus bisporus var. burnettii]
MSYKTTDPQRRTFHPILSLDIIDTCHSLLYHPRLAHVKPRSRIRIHIQPVLVNCSTDFAIRNSRGLDPSCSLNRVPATPVFTIDSVHAVHWSGILSH